MTKKTCDRLWRNRYDSVDFEEKTGEPDNSVEPAGSATEKVRGENQDDREEDRKTEKIVKKEEEEE